MWKNIKNLSGQLVDNYFSELRLVFHDGGIVLFFLFLPLIYPIIYSLIYNPEVVRDVRMVVVDRDRTAASRELVRKLDATQEVWIAGYAAEMGEARHAMNSHDCYGILEIPDGFGRNIGRGKQAVAVLYADMSLLLRYRGFLLAATNVAQDMGSEILARKIDDVIPLAVTVSAGDPLPNYNVSMGNTKNGFDSFVMPGVVVLILHQCIVLALGMAGGARRENPLMAGRNVINGTKSVAVSMLGEMLCYVTILIVPTLFLLHYVPLIFSFPMAGNVLEIFCFILPMVIACIGLGFCFQGVVRERESVFVLWVASSIVILFLSGLIWPRYAMPEFWRLLGDIIPATWGIEGFVKMNTNGASLAQVRSEYVNLWIMSGVYFVVGYCVRRWYVWPKLRRKALAMQSDV